MRIQNESVTPRKVRSRVSVDIRLFWIGVAATVLAVIIVPSYIGQGRMLDQRTANEAESRTSYEESLDKERVLWAREVASLCSLIERRLRYNEEPPQICFLMSVGPDGGPDS